MIRAKVGNRIKELRTSMQISQEKLALKAGVDRTYLASVEAGNRNISVINLEKIIIALEISFGEFFQDM